MENVSSREMLGCIRQGFRQALSGTDAIVENYRKSAASRLSSKFVSEVANVIHASIFPDRNLQVIGVNDDGGKLPGEWLLDACITEDTDGFKDRVIFAMESESDTSKREFDRDFAKLVHVNAATKLYLNGLNQLTNDGVETYIKDRIEYAEEVLRRTRSSGQWFIAFWPSPGKLRRTETSAWQCLPSHLAEVRLFEFRGKFVEVNGSAPV